ALAMSAGIGADFLMNFEQGIFQRVHHIRQRLFDIEARQRGRDHLAGDFTSVMAAHAVGHYPQTIVVAVKKRIFVHVAHGAAMGGGTAAPMVLQHAVVYSLWPDHIIRTNRSPVARWRGKVSSSPAIPNLPPART